jgi:hypothetical protein
VRYSRGWLHELASLDHLIIRFFKPAVFFQVCNRSIPILFQIFYKPGLSITQKKIWGKDKYVLVARSYFFGQLVCLFENETVSASLKLISSQFMIQQRIWRDL